MSTVMELVDATLDRLGREAGAREVAEGLGGTLEEAGGTLLVSASPLGSAHLVRAAGTDVPAYVTLTLDDPLPVADLQARFGEGTWRPGDEDRSGRSLLFKVDAGERAAVTVQARVRSGREAAHELVLRPDPR